MASSFPVDPTSGLSLRGLTKAGQLAVEVLRVRTRLVPSDTGQLPLYGPFEVPLPSDRALVAAYAHPFVADAITTGPDPSDARVVRPICAIRGPRSLELAVPANIDGEWPLAMTGTIEAGPLGKQSHYLQEDMGALPVSSSHTRPQRIVSVRDLGANAANPTAGNDYSIMMNSGNAARVGPLLVAPAPGDEYPADSEGDDRISVGSIGRAQEIATPRRNMYNVPVQSDPEDAASGPLDQEANPDIVMSVRTVFDLPLNPTTEVQKVSLMSGASVVVPIGQNVVVGKPLSNCLARKKIVFRRLFKLKHRLFN